MNDPEIEKLFADFRPELPASERFLDSLSSRLDLLESVRQANAARVAALKRRARLAALAGVLTGAAMTLLSPYILAGISALLARLPLPDAQALGQVATLLTWLAVGLSALAAALVAPKLAENYD